jgi:major membrane immunogen (membrane-anchored lipoprotein)
MRKISLFVFLMLLTNLLAGCGLLPYFNNEELSGEKGTQNVEAHPTQDPDYQASSSSGEASSDKTESGEPDDTYKTDTGTFQGQIDNNFIEIAISGVPKEKAIKVFMLSDDIKKEFDGMELSIGAIIKFQYFNNESGQNVIVKIEKTK